GLSAFSADTAGMSSPANASATSTIRALMIHSSGMERLSPSAISSTREEALRIARLPPNPLSHEGRGGWALEGLASTGPWRFSGPPRLYPPHKAVGRRARRPATISHIARARSCTRSGEQSMSAIRIVAILVVVLAGLTVPAAAPPASLHVARWVED